MNLKFFIFIIFFICGFVFTSASASKVKILSAGSLIVPLNDVGRAFEKEHPGIDVEIEGHGSIQVVREVTDLRKNVDVIFVADYSLIPDLMFNRKMPNLDMPYADWYLKFSSNEIVIAFTDKSKYADKINSDNWYEILSKPDVKFGFSDPTLDACGYRTLMLLQLAEEYYKNKSIFENLISKNFNPTFFVERDGENYVINVPTYIDPKASKVVIRRSSILLTSLIESNSLDYGFIYLSVAKQHNLNYVKLPPEINLGNKSYAKYYKKVLVKFQFHRFEYIPALTTRVGLPIEYALTIPNNAPNKELAIEFVKFLLSDKGKKIFYKNYQKIYERLEMFGNATEIKEMVS